MGEPNVPDDTGAGENNPDPEIVIVEGSDTAVVVEGKSDAAQAQALIAEQTAENASQEAAAAAEVAVAAGTVAIEADSRTTSLAEDFAAFRGEFGEVRGFVGELYQDFRARKDAEEAAAQASAQVEEVPVNDRAASEKAGSEHSDSAGSKPKKASSSGGEARPEEKPAQRGGLRHRRR